MIDFRYAARQVGAAWSMAWNRPGWADALDRSVDGVFRSFFAMAIAAPFLVLNFVSIRAAARAGSLQSSDPSLSAPLTLSVPVQMAGVYLDWLATLTALAFVARAVGAARRAAELIAGYNWLQIPIAAALCIPSAALLVPGGAALAGLCFIPAIGLVFSLLFGYLRRALVLDPVWTFATLVLMTLIGVVVQTLATRLAFGLVHVFS